jgi:hypothetical protein
MAIKAQFDAEPMIDGLPYFFALNLLLGLSDLSLRALNRST